MIDWGIVAAFTGPLVGAIGLASGWFAWLGRQREKRTGDQISMVTSQLESSQALMQVRITQVEAALVAQGHHLDKQDEAMMTAMQAIARIEGRLAGPVDRGVTAGS